MNKYPSSHTNTRQAEKAAQCKNLDITVLVDNDGRNIKKVRLANFSAIYFGVEVRNWQAIFRVSEDYLEP